MPLVHNTRKKGPEIDWEAMDNRPTADEYYDPNIEAKEKEEDDVFENKYQDFYGKYHAFIKAREKFEKSINEDKCENSDLDQHGSYENSVDKKCLEEVREVKQNLQGAKKPVNDLYEKIMKIKIQDMLKNDPKVIDHVYYGELNKRKNYIKIFNKTPWVNDEGYIAYFKNIEYDYDGDYKTNKDKLDKINKLLETIYEGAIKRKYGGKRRTRKAKKSKKQRKTKRGKKTAKKGKKSHKKKSTRRRH